MQKNKYGKQMVMANFKVMKLFLVNNYFKPTYPHAPSFFECTHSTTITQQENCTLEYPLNTFDKSLNEYS